MMSAARAATAIGFVLTAGCGGVNYSKDASIGPPGDVAAIRAYERALWGQGVIARPGSYPLTGIVVDSDVAVATVLPGEGGWVTLVLRRQAGRWTPLAQKANAPGPCLYRIAHVDPQQGRRLTDSLIAIAPGYHVYPDDRRMEPDGSHIYPCERPTTPRDRGF